MLWVPALAITIASILDFGLFMLYNKAGHPWKEILKEEVILEIEEDFDGLTLDMDVLPEDLLDLPEDNVNSPLHGSNDQEGELESII